MAMKGLDRADRQALGLHGFNGIGHGTRSGQGGRIGQFISQHGASNNDRAAGAFFPGGRIDDQLYLSVLDQVGDVRPSFCDLFYSLIAIPAAAKYREVPAVAIMSNPIS